MSDSRTQIFELTVLSSSDDNVVSRGYVDVTSWEVGPEFLTVYFLNKSVQLFSLAPVKIENNIVGSSTTACRDFEFTFLRNRYVVDNVEVTYEEYVGRETC